MSASTASCTSRTSSAALAGGRSWAAWYTCRGRASGHSVTRRRSTTTGCAASPPTSTAAAHPVWIANPAPMSTPRNLRRPADTDRQRLAAFAGVRGRCLVSDGSSGLSAGGAANMPNVDGGSLWELVERRAAATPDALAAVDEDGRTLTWAEAKTEAERAAAGLARHGIGAGDVVSWQLPTWLESKVLVLALARLGAIQNPMLPIYREREVGFITRQAKSKLLVVPSTWSGFDFEAMAKGIAAAIAAEGGVARGARRRQGAAAGRPVHAARRRPIPATTRSAGTSTRRARRPTRRAPSTPTARSRPAPSACASGSRSPTPTATRCVFPFTHIGGIGWLFSALVVRVPDRVHRARSTRPRPSR